MDLKDREFSTVFNNAINQFFIKRLSPKDREQRRKEAALKKVLKETSVGHGMWLGAGQAKATEYEVAGISELPSFEREDSVTFLHENQGQGPRAACV